MKSVMIDNLEYCYFCRKPREAIHHVFPGSRRKASERYGYTVPLCNGCHTLDNDSVHMAPNRGKDLLLKKKAQWHFENHCGNRKAFIANFGKSYL